MVTFLSSSQHTLTLTPTPQVWEVLSQLSLEEQQRMVNQAMEFMIGMHAVSLLGPEELQQRLDQFDEYVDAEEQQELESVMESMDEKDKQVVATSVYQF